MGAYQSKDEEQVVTETEGEITDMAGNLVAKAHARMARMTALAERRGEDLGKAASSAGIFWGDPVFPTNDNDVRYD